MNRNILAGAAALVCVVACSENAEASGIYIAAGYDAAWPTYGTATGYDAPATLEGGDVAVGWRFNRYYSVEVDYAYATGSRNVYYGLSTRLSLQTGMVDAFGYLPLGRYSDFAPFATLGVGAIDGTAKAAYVYFGSHSADASSTELSARVGGGIAWQFMGGLGARAMLRYQWNDSSDVHGATTFTLGLVANL